MKKLLSLLTLLMISNNAWSSGPAQANDQLEAEEDAFYDALESIQEKNEQCPICHADFISDNEEVVELSCGCTNNLMHGDCIRLWFGDRENTSCPMCTKPAVITKDAAIKKLFNAINANDLNQVTELIAAGTELNQPDSNDDTPLLKAVKSNKLEITQILSTAGADINIQDKNGNNALMIALQNNKPEIAQILISAGANINFINKFDRSALMEAAIYNQLDIARSLITAGADVNLKNKFNQTALIKAAMFPNRLNMIRILISAGADVNIQDLTQTYAPGYTALMFIAGQRRSDPEIAQVLLDAGADISIQSVNGLTALSMATTSGNTPVADLIRAHIKHEHPGFLDRLKNVFGW